MAVYRNISVTFWTDSKIDDDFTPEDKYFYLYLLTNPHTNICGCYELSIKQMTRETGYKSQKVKEELQRLDKIHKVIIYDYKTKEVLIINWSKYNWSKSEKVEKAVLRVSNKIKSEKFKKIITALNNNSILNKNIYNTVTVTVTDTVSVSETAVCTDTDTDTDTVVSIGYGYPMDTLSETATDTETTAETDKNTDINRFKPPTIEEIKAYCKERNNNVDAEAFFDFYTANGWVQGNQNKPLKDWKAAVKLWEKNKFSEKKDNTGTDIEEYKSVINKFLY